jgi:hypothetical protein
VEVFWYWRLPSGDVAHDLCHENEYWELERFWLDSQTAIEALAKQMNLPASNVAVLPKYARDGQAASILDQQFPEWRQRIRETLQSRRRKQTTE